MGSFFSAPTPSYTPFQYPTSTSQATQNAAQNSVEETDVDSDDTTQVKDIIRRNSRGRSSLIQTSYRGVLGADNGSLVPQRKSLLGE